MSSHTQQQQPTSNGQAVQPLHHPGQHALVPKTNLPAHAQGHSEMGGKALLAKKMAASGKSFYSPTDTMVSPCTAKLHLAKKKHHTKGKPVALSSSFSNNNANTATNPLKKTSGLTSAGFLHPSHAASARFHLTNESDFEAETRSQDEEAKKAAPVQQADDDDEEMEM